MEVTKTKTGARRSMTACIAIALAVVGCASKPPAPAQGKTPPNEIKVYQTPDLLHSQFKLVEHVWIDSWHSNITYPSFKAEADGLDAMKRAASDAGANALIHVICLDARDKPSDATQLNCYGDAIHVN